MKLNKKSNLLLLASVSTIAVLQSGIASAQNASDTNDVVVTAERRTQRLQDVPISATVIAGADLARKGVTGIADIQQVAPSIAINTVNRSVFINIRGVGIAQSAPTSNPGVAYYIDGQLIPHEQFIGQSFYDIGSIEVLRGPQGTLTGQNSTGGAIYVRTPAPKYDEISGIVEGTFGDYGKTRLFGALNVGLGNNLALRISGVTDQRDSFTSNIANPNSQPGNVDLMSYRANLAFRALDERVTANLRYEYFDYDTDNNAVKRRNDTISSDPFEIQESANSYLRQKGERISLETNIALTEWAKLRYVGSTQNGFTRDQTDGDRSATALPRVMGVSSTNANTGRVSYAFTKFNTRTHEVNILSTNDGPIQWVVGGFLMDETIPLDLLRDNYNTVNFVAATNITNTKAVNSTESVFGQVNWKFAEKLEAILGLRTSTDTQTYYRYYVSVNNPTLGPLAAPSTSFGVQESDQTTGKFGLNYRTDAGTLLYATYSKGYKAGGVNLTPGTANFGPETNMVTEIGMKSKLFDNRLTLNFSVFSSDYQDIQLSSQVGGLPVTQNAASGTAKGFEIEGVLREGGVTVNFGLGYLDATFAEDTCISDTNSPGTDAGCPTNLRRVVKGRDLPFSPEWTINAGVQYAWRLDNGMTLTPRLQWSHTAEQWATPFQYTQTFVGSRDVLDARVILDVNDALTVEAFLNNIANATYVTTQLQGSSSADGGTMYGAPRNGGIRVAYKFGN